MLARASESASDIRSRMWIRPDRACSRASDRTSEVMPEILMSIWRAVADLPPAGTAQELHLPHREGGEVVVQHEALLVVGLLHRVDDLHVLGGAEGHGDEGLRLAAGEQRRPVGAGQHADLAADGPD